MTINQPCAPYLSCNADSLLQMLVTPKYEADTI